MGLISDYRKYKKQKELLTFLKDEYGITKDDLSYIHEALEIVKNKELNKPVVIDEKTQKEIQEKQALKMTPEQFVEVFAKETEEFYPYGKPKE